MTDERKELPRHDRRWVLKALGGGLATLTGCASGSRKPSPEATTAPSPTSTRERLESTATSSPFPTTRLETLTPVRWQPTPSATSAPTSKPIEVLLSPPAKTPEPTATKTPEPTATPLTEEITSLTELKGYFLLEDPEIIKTIKENTYAWGPKVISREKGQLSSFFEPGENEKLGEIEIVWTILATAAENMGLNPEPQPKDPMETDLLYLFDLVSKPEVLGVPQVEKVGVLKKIPIGICVDLFIPETNEKPLVLTTHQEGFWTVLKPEQGKWYDLRMVNVDEVKVYVQINELCDPETCAGVMADFSAASDPVTGKPVNLETPLALRVKPLCVYKEEESPTLQNP